MAFQGNAFQGNAFQIPRAAVTAAFASGPQPQVGWGTGRKHGIAGQRHDDIKIEQRKLHQFTELEIQEIDNHDIMLFAKTFRKYMK